MADPLSIAASLITVVQISGQIISYCYDYRRGLKNASRDLSRVTAEVTSLRNVLEVLVVLVDDERNASNNFLPMLTDVLLTDGLLDVCQRDLGSLIEKIEKPVSEWKALGRRLIWPLQEKDVTRTLESVHRTRSVLETALMVDTTASITEIRNTTRDLRERVLDITRSITLAPETELQVIVDWLDGPDPSMKHRKVREARESQTGKWFLQRKDYGIWQTEANSCFWLHGIPGCGKSVLCSSIIEDVIHLPHREQHSIVLYYYFDFANKVESSVQSLLRSLVTQLAKQAPELLKALKQIKYEKCNNRLNGIQFKPVTQPSLLELSDLLHDSIGGFDYFYVILDALDECVERQEVLSLVKRFMESGTGKVHVLATSRYEVDIEEQLLHIITGQVQIESHFIEPDIRSHIQQQLRKNPRLKKWPQKVKERMESALVEGSQGMFRWAACQLDVLSRCKVLKQLDVALKTPPKDLAETYQRALQNLDPESYEIVYKLLMWLTVRLEEAVDFLAIDEGNGEELIFDPDMRLFDANDILTMCTGLVSVSRIFIKSKEGALVQQVQEIRLAHSSVKGFLLLHFQKQPLPPLFRNIDSQAYVAQCCLAYLLHFREPSQYGKDIAQYPLARYAAEWWMRHMQHSQSKTSPLGTQLALDLMDESSTVFLDWIRLYNPDKPWQGADASAKNHASALYYASQSGLEYLVDQLLRAGSKPDYGQGMFGTPLQVATYNGHLQVAKKLLSAGACPNTKGGMFYTPLKAAAAIGHVDLIRLLIKHGANPNVSTLRSGTALLEATKNRHSDVTRVLIDEGQADINIVGSRKAASIHGTNPLQIASRNCDIKIVSQILPKASKSIIAIGLQKAACTESRELLELYASYNPDGVLHYAAKSGWADLVTKLLKNDAATSTTLDDGYSELDTGSSSLVVAAAGGHESIVRELILNKADVNAVSDRRYALESAAEKGFSSIISLLLMHGADVNACGLGGTALQKASLYGNIDIVKQFLDYGADVNIVDDSYGGPLQPAVIGGHHEVAELLLDRGADINAQPGEWWYSGDIPLCSTPLTAATYRGDIEMFDFLLNKGARTDLQDELHPPALHVAVKENHPAIMAKILAAGANIEVEHQGSTPLAEAINVGNFAAAQELLKAGASPNHDILEYGYIKRTLLNKAIWHDEVELLKLLLDFGADVSALSDVGKSSKEPPLHTATEKGSLDMVRILLEQRADYNWQDDTGWTVSHIAARHHPEILRLLCDDYGADLSLSLPNGSLPLHSAASGGNVVCVEILLAHHVDINRRNNHGRTPLHFAVEKGNFQAVKVFLEKEARIDIKEKDTRMTPLDYAKMELIKEPDNLDRQSIVEILEEKTT